MPIYTRRGDNGQTSLRDGTKISKSSCHSEVIGNLDELITELGFILCTYDNNIKETNTTEVSFLYDFELKFIEDIQLKLFEIGTLIANPSNNKRFDKVFDIDDVYTVNLEQRINTMDDKLPRLKNFILMQGNIQMMYCNKARVLCRRFERSLISHINESDSNFLKTNCSKYMNRLSDYLFTLSRFIGYCCKIPEKVIMSSGECKTYIDINST